MKMQLMSADVDQPPGMWELPSFERGRNALIRGSSEGEEEDDCAAGEKRAAEGR